MQEPQISISSSNPSTQSTMCGICLSGSARSIRARINGCDHEFCFVCIMEWAKVESRCPLCRRRFEEVCRPVVHGLFEQERVVRICERNQVYDPHRIGNRSTRGSINRNTNCTVCNSSENKSYLLACNLCNSASHTFCSGRRGFRWSVPNSNWYCADCTISITEHERYQPETLENFPPGKETLEKIRAVRNGDFIADLNIYNFAGGTQELIPVAEVARVNSNNSFYNTHKRLQNRINFIRANWDLMRAGEVEFKAGFVHPNEEKIRKSSVESSRNRDVKKSWKMLSKAKPVIKKKKSVDNNNCVNSSVGSRPLFKNNSVNSSRQRNSNVAINLPVFPRNVNPNTSRSTNQLRKDAPRFGNGNVCNKKSVLMIKNQEEAKSKIKSMVKDNLMLYKLGTDRFKEVARISTHSILSACGYNHCQLTARYFPKLPCYHNNEIRSNSMPNYCKQCFYSFVYEVVKSISSE